MAISLEFNPGRVPGAYFSITANRAQSGTFAWPAKILVVGQKHAAAPMPVGVPERITNAAEAEARAGKGSMLARMLATVLATQPQLDVRAVALDDNPAGAAAAGALTFGGSPTAAGTLVLYLAGQRVEVGISAAQTPAAIATAVVAAIGADTGLPVTAAVDGGNTAKVNLTARHKGEAGNSLDVRHSYYPGEGLPPGLTLAITAMAGGTGNPSVQAALDAIGDDWVTDLVLPYTDAANLAAAEAKAGTNFGPLVMRDLHVWAGAAGSFASLTTLGSGRNSPHLTIVGAKGSPTPPWEWAAAWCAQCVYHLAIDPARPVQTLPLARVLAPAVTDRFTAAERNLLLFDGISTFTVDAAGYVRIERAITTYQTSAAGAADTAYLDVETVKTVAFLRHDLRSFILQRYPRHKLANDGTNVGPGQAVVTPGLLKAEIIGRARLWEELGLVEGLDQFKAQILVERDQADRTRVNAIIPPDIVNQLRIVAGDIQFLL